MAEYFFSIFISLIMLYIFKWTIWEMSMFACIYAIMLYQSDKK